jgi:hypothetical protein
MALTWRRLASWSAVRSVAVLTVACLSFVASRAHAQQPGPIVLVRSSGDAKAIAPLRAELGVLGWSMLEVADDRRLAQLAIRHRAFAVIRLRPPRRAELWLSATDTVPGEALSLSEASDDRVLSLKIVERLRARWQQLSAGEERNATPAPASSPATLEPRFAAPPSTPPVLWLGAGAGVLSSSDGLGSQANAVADVAYYPLPLLACELTGTWPLSKARLDSAEGSTDVRIWSLALTLSARLERPRWDIQVGGGPVLGWLKVEGSAVAPYESRQDTARIRGAHFRGGFGLKLARTWWLRARGTLGLGFEEASVVVADRSVARFGLPFMLADVTIAWGLF